LPAVVAAVLAVVAIGAASAAAPDRKPPRIVAGAMLDRDGDQRGDALRLSYSERIHRPIDRDGTYPFIVVGYRIQTVAASSGRTLLLTLIERPVVDAGVKPLVRYRRTSAKPVLDRAGNQAVAQAFRGVRPLERVPLVVPPAAAPPPPPNPAAPPDRDPDRDGYTDPADCKPNDAAVHPGAADLPDLGFADTNCDGIDGTEAKAVFASPQGDDANPGTKDKPKRQIQAAVTAAAASGRYVLAAAGSYTRIVAATGVSIYGGYAPPNWERQTQPTTQITGSPEGLLADGAKDVTLQLLGIRGVTGTGIKGRPALGASAYGIRAINGSTLRLQRVTVSAGDGAPGAPGKDGAPGRPGGDGQPGAKGACDSNVTAPGGAGGTSPVGRDGGKGGDGRYEDYGQQGAAGLIGTPGGFGGARAFNGSGNSGRPGANGNSGAPGSAGVGGTNASTDAAATWRGRDGTPGSGGAAGNGGGGGGAGGGQEKPWVMNGTGNGGGGGGGGAQGGGGGTGGGAGGGSFAAYLYFSTLLAEGTTITAGAGGVGGRGGNGGQGGTGGSGALGFHYCKDEIGNGGQGGRGGDGGEGGGAGGGSGGPSIGIFAKGSATDNVILTDTKVIAGAPGPGGAAGASATAATKGAAGIAQAVYP